MTYKEYSEIVKVVYSEELERLDEWIYSMTNGYDCSGDKYWIKESPGDIPSLDELEQLMEGVDQALLFSDEGTVMEDTVDLIRSKWMQIHTRY
jgi:hypothetical protein